MPSRGAAHSSSRASRATTPTSSGCRCPSPCACCASSATTCSTGWATAPPQPGDPSPAARRLTLAEVGGYGVSSTREGLRMSQDDAVRGAAGGAATLHATARAYLIFTGTGPILVLSTYPQLTDPRLIAKLRYKGIDKFIAYEVDLHAVEARYPHAFPSIAQDLQSHEDI